MKTYAYYILLIFAFFSLQSSAKGIEVTGLQTEQLINPMGIDTAEPSVSWRIESSAKDVRQTAYQILMASSPELLKNDD